MPKIIVKKDGSFKDEVKAILKTSRERQKLMTE
jgi:hypothetical protein